MSTMPTHIGLARLTGSSPYSLNVMRKCKLVLLAACATVAADVAAHPAIAACNSGSGGTLMSGSCQAVATGDFATAVGNSAQATDVSTLAFGFGASATAQSATALGGGAQASALAALAIGGNANATGDFAMAVGAGTYALGEGATAVGYGSGRNEAVAGATTIGYRSGNTGIGFYSTAIGAGTLEIHTPPAAKGDYSVAIGGGDGANFTPAGGSTINLNGALASGFLSAAVGAASQATGGGSSAFGVGSKASGNDSAAFGDFSTANGVGSIAIGLFSFAAGNNGTAAGNHASAGGGSSSAYGQISRAAGLSSAAFGAASFASGPHGVALGGSSKAGGADHSTDATAIGYGASATAISSVALGAASVADVDHTMSVGSIGSERRIMNVANAQKNTDAVNLRQVKNLIAAATLASASPAAQNQMSSVTPLRVAGIPQALTHARGKNPSLGPVDERSNRNAIQQPAFEPSEIVGWANMNHDGTLSGSRNVSGNARHGIGRYEIVFNGTTPKRCTYQITVAGVGYASVKAGPGAGSLNIETRNHQGVLTDSGFYLMAVC